jgi:hypothetical protein
LAHSGDKIIYQYVVTNPQGDTVWVLPLQQITGLLFETNDSILTITAIANLNTPLTFSITAKNNGVSAPLIDIPIANITYIPIPITDQYFKFTTTFSTDDTVIGFSDAVVSNPNSIPSDCNAIDFTTKPDIKYVDGNANFSPNVFEARAFLKLNLSNLEFRFNDQRQSGYNTFYCTNLSSLIELDLTNTDFASSFIGSGLPNYNDISTAYHTFDGANLSGLGSLNLNGTIFAVANLSDSGRIFTADSTFVNTNLSGLVSLNLDSAIFAKSSMSISGDIYTACNTFGSADISGLNSLELKNVEFATNNMSLYGDIYTACYTFQYTIFFGLRSLDLSHAIFASSAMTAYSVATAYFTFHHANLSKLNSLILDNAIFAMSNMISVGNTNDTSVRTAYCTFANANISGLNSLNLSNTKFAATNMTIYGEIFTAVATFSHANFS